MSTNKNLYFDSASAAADESIITGGKAILAIMVVGVIGGAIAAFAASTSECIVKTSSNILSASECDETKLNERAGKLTTAANKSKFIKNLDNVS